MFKKLARKQPRTQIRNLDARNLRPLSAADLRLVSGGGSAGASTNHGGAGATDDVTSVE
jgi:hypothetical protein